MMSNFEIKSGSWIDPLGRPARVDGVPIDEGLRAYVLRVYNWMASGLLLTASSPSCW
jgi:FtsH-binding integral membrane protein